MYVCNLHLFTLRYQITVIYFLRFRLTDTLICSLFISSLLLTLAIDLNPHFCHDYLIFLNSCYRRISAPRNTVVGVTTNLYSLPVIFYSDIRFSRFHSHFTQMKIQVFEGLFFADKKFLDFLRFSCRKYFLFSTLNIFENLTLQLVYN